MDKTRGLKKYFGRQVTASVLVSWRTGEELDEEESDLAIVCLKIGVGGRGVQVSHIYIQQNYII